MCSLACCCHQIGGLSRSTSAIRTSYLRITQLLLTLTDLLMIEVCNTQESAHMDFSYTTFAHIDSPYNVEGSCRYSNPPTVLIGKISYSNQGKAAT